MCSASEVAPLKQLPIPRLELHAAVLLAKLCRKATLGFSIAIFLWTDSCIVPTWFQGPSSKWTDISGQQNYYHPRRHLQLGDMCHPSVMTKGIFVAGATCHFTSITSTRYVPFIFVPENSGVGTFISVRGDLNNGHQQLTLWILKNYNCLLNLLLMCGWPCVVIQCG